MTGRIWTISNALSLLRLVLVVPIVILLRQNDGADRPLIGALILLAVASDFFDGLIARKLGQVTDVGKILDPIADKIAVAAAGIALAVLGRIPMWFLGAALLRDVLILAGGVYVTRSRDVVLQSNAVGKWTVVAIAAYLLMAAMGLEGIGQLETALLGVSCIMMVASSISYARRLFQVLGRS